MLRSIRYCDLVACVTCGGRSTPRDPVICPTCQGTGERPNPNPVNVELGLTVRLRCDGYWPAGFLATGTLGSLEPYALETGAGTISIVHFVPQRRTVRASRYVYGIGARVHQRLPIWLEPVEGNSHAIP